MQSLLLVNEENFDFATSLGKDKISRLLDGQASVELVEFSPRIVPKGYTPEYLIVKAARTSFGKGLKDPVTDATLLEYLFTNKHTSPLEMCNVTLRVKIPLPVGVQYLRHRTGKFNQFSQRYAEVDDDLGTYDPTAWDKGIRFQSTTNKQGSTTEEKNLEGIKAKFHKAALLQKEIADIYHSLIKEDNVAKEIARFLLPQAQYTTLYMQFDLNNLIKLLFLRNDSHAQFETMIIAKAIEELCEPLFPTIFRAYRNQKEGFSFQSDEVEAFKETYASFFRVLEESSKKGVGITLQPQDVRNLHDGKLPKTDSRSRRLDYVGKIKRLRSV